MPSVCENVIATVELFVAGKVHFDKVQWVREFARNGASSAAFHDLTSCSPKAAAHLAAWETANDSAHAAALNVIRCAALAAGFRAMGPAGHAAQEIERIFLENELKRWLRQRAEMMAGSE